MKIVIQKKADHWDVHINGVYINKAKRLLSLVKTLVKYIKGHPELDKD